MRRKDALLGLTVGADGNKLTADQLARKKTGLMQGVSSKLNSWVKTAKRGKESCAVICEILDSRTERTIRQSKSVMMASDFVQVRAERASV